MKCNYSTLPGSSFINNPPLCPHLTLITSLNASSPNVVTLGVWLQYMN